MKIGFRPTNMAEARTKKGSKETFFECCRRECKFWAKRGERYREAPMSEVDTWIHDRHEFAERKKEPFAGGAGTYEG
jgi:hypothetical protein